MVYSSKLRVYSVIKNCCFAFLKDQKIEKLDRLFSIYCLKNSNKFINTIITRIYQEIENNYYTYKDLIFYCLYFFIINDKIGNLYSSINIKNIQFVKSIFTTQQLEKDKEYLIEVSRKMGLKKPIEYYFTLGENNKTIIFDLIKSNLISPVFWLKYSYIFERIKQNREESEEHKKFRMLMEYLKPLINL